ncbi:hypothetical protein SAMN00790413_04525 [Deinococcus hopiensis KR-140]|uniref:Uncharacterized protein n=1 Tax=Deinococcus hopiensis KR-140 TaxID=695939 RepID=A0A1W1UJP2_9DEIO|nr:hypothetical protein SAMN00790413_04525 [Deinococcus hopiensis KR-140]
MLGQILLKMVISLVLIPLMRWVPTHVAEPGAADSTGAPLTAPMS